MRKQLLGCFGVILVLALAASLVANVVFSRQFNSRGAILPPDAFNAVLAQPAASGSHDAPFIVQIDLTGVISNDSLGGGESLVTRTKRALTQAVDDPAIKAIVLRIDSPGGEVTASDTIYHAVQQANARKPVVVFMDSIAASGGYYIACGARKIVANPVTWTGSIGVVVQTLGYHGLFDKAGLKMRVFRSGALKDTLYGHRELTPEEESYLQSIVNQTYERFVSIVASARSISPEQLKASVADGRILTGAEALTQKLVDRNGYLEDAFQLAREEAGLKDAAVIHYSPPSSLLSDLGILSSLSSSPIPSRIELDISDRILPRLQPGRVYLLPAHMAD
jgi:protease-4